MEQQLIDALNKANSSDDIDEVSKEMIVARVISVLTEVRDATQEYLDKLQAIQKDHAMELKLGGLALVLNVTDDIASAVHKGPTQMYALGNRDKMLKNIAQLMEKIHG